MSIDVIHHVIKFPVCRNFFVQEAFPMTVKYADGEMERLGNFLLFKELLWNHFMDCKPATQYPTYF